MSAPPKRPAEPYPSTSTTSSSKKPRFDPRNPSTLAAPTNEDDPDTNELDDLILNADVIGKSGAQTKRRAVRIDGYESDSEEEGFRVRERERAGKKDSREAPASKDEEEDDMFAELEEGGADGAGEGRDGDEDEELAREGKKGGKKKDVRFLDQKEIEGQVMGSRSGGHVSSELLMDARGKGKGNERRKSGGKGGKDSDYEEESSSGEDEARDALPSNLEDDLALEIGAGGKKKHAPRLDAFNLKEEEEEGRFDEAGNYVRLATDPDANNDTWLEGLSRKDMRKAKAAQEAREDAQRVASAKNDALLTEDVLGTLIGFLEGGETVLEALQRLNKGKKGEQKKKAVPKWKLKKQQKQKGGEGNDDEMVVDSQNGDNGHTDVDPAEAARRAKIEVITAAADALYSRAQHEIYDTEREMLMRQFRRETGEEWKPSAAAASLNDAGGDAEAAAPADGEQAAWHFRWSDARDGGGAHGPYDSATMKAWQEAGYFGEGVEFRRGGDEGEWSRVLDVR